jgi:hypothetical protein
MIYQPLEPRQLVGKLRPGLGIAVREVNADDEYASDCGLDVSGLLIARVAWQAAARQDGLRTAGKDGDSVPCPLALPDGDVARVLNGGFRKLAVFGCRVVSNAATRK